MSSQPIMKTTQDRETLPPKGAQATQTAWKDPWAATRSAATRNSETRSVLRLLALYERRASAQRDLLSLQMGRKITEEINADPAEVERLRAAREDIRKGRTFPRHSDTK
jgi:hypothetical protein